MHCTAGKDRTGVSAALLLLLLGVAREHVIEDYALTGLYTGGRIGAAERFFSGRGIEPDRVRALLGSEPSTLAAALDHLEEAHGGAERWAKGRAGLTDTELGALREALVESRLGPLDLRPERAQALVDALVAAVHLVGVHDHASGPRRRAPRRAAPCRRGCRAR